MNIPFPEEQKNKGKFNPSSQPFSLPQSSLHQSESEVPKKQKAQIFEKKGGPIKYKDIDVPKPGPDEVLINIKYSGVCHTGKPNSLFDLSLWLSKCRPSRPEG